MGALGPGLELGSDLRVNGRLGCYEALEIEHRHKRTNENKPSRHLTFSGLCPHPRDTTKEAGLSSTPAPISTPEPLDILCFSHLRWHFVTQRPQHLLTRAARSRRVFFWEEPVEDGDAPEGGRLEVMEEGERLWVIKPHVRPGTDALACQRELLRQLLADFAVHSYVAWYYTPMALAFTDELRPAVTVYDCMDELSGFMGAPPELREREAELFRRADVVFTGGMSLFESKRRQHGNVHAFPSSIDVPHFRAARDGGPEPQDQAPIAHPRAGFYGVVDERFDTDLVREVARLRPQVQFVFLGPVVKIAPEALPQSANIHYLGSKKYPELPQYLAGWDVALLPFARNESTRFISPTKTPEYLAAGKPVVSTPIHDVVSGYGDEGLVAIAETPEEFAAAIDRALEPPAPGWREKVEAKLATNSWDETWAAMWRAIEAVKR